MTYPKMRRLIGLAIPLLLTATGLRADIGYDASYTLTLGPLTVGEMQRRYRVDNAGAYRFESHIRSTGLASFLRSDELHEVSSGVLRNGAFSPDRYSYERKNKRKPRSVLTVFNRDAGTIETLYNGESRTSNLEPGTLDKLVYQAQIMLDLAAGKTTLHYPVTDRGRGKAYSPVIAGEERIETKSGQYDTIKLVRERKKDKKRTIFWCAPALGFLPVKVAHREKNGNETIVTLETITVHAPDTPHDSRGEI